MRGNTLTLTSQIDVGFGIEGDKIEITRLALVRAFKLDQEIKTETGKLYLPKELFEMYLKYLKAQKPRLLSGEIATDIGRPASIESTDPFLFPDPREEFKLPRKIEDPIKAIERETSAFLRLKESLLENEEYRGKFIAVFQGEIVDYGEDKRELAKRVYERFGYVPIYIDKVEKEKEIVRLPSPIG